MNSERTRTLKLDDFINFVVDAYLPDMSSSEFKVYMYIYRQTIGANVQMAPLAITKIMKETALTRNTVLKVLKALERKGYISKLTRLTPHRVMLNYSRIFTGDESKFEPGYFRITEKYATPTNIVFNYPKKE